LERLGGMAGPYEAHTRVSVTLSAMSVPVVGDRSPLSAGRSCTLNFDAMPGQLFSGPAGAGHAETRHFGGSFGRRGPAASQKTAKTGEFRPFLPLHRLHFPAK